MRNWAYHYVACHYAECRGAIVFISEASSGKMFLKSRKQISIGSSDRWLITKWRSLGHFWRSLQWQVVLSSCNIEYQQFQIQIRIQNEQNQFLNRSTKFMTGVKTKLLTDEGNKIKQNWIFFVHYCSLLWHSVTVVGYCRRVDAACFT